jgi:DNA-binding protein HU-beta
MNRKELVSAVADECGFRTGDTELVINTVLKHIVENVANGEEIRLSHFGTFKAIPRNGRVARNPRTGERVEVEAKNEKLTSYTNEPT